MLLLMKQLFSFFSAIATSLCLAGILVYAVSDTAFKMVSLSNQYDSASTVAQKSALLAAAQTVLAKGIPGAGYQGIGGLGSMFLIAIAGLVISLVMLRSRIFSRITGYVGIVASAFDLAYINSLAFVPATDFYLISSFFVGGAGLLLMIWHLLIGVKLYRLGSTPKVKGVVNP